MDKLRVVLGNATLANYQAGGGGHWSVRLQYLLGMLALGHDPFLLELMRATGDIHADEKLITSFFGRLGQYGLTERAAVLYQDWERLPRPGFESAQAYGKSKREIAEIIASADMLWNDCAMIRQPLLGMFKRRVLVDLDPGHLQVSALSHDLNLLDHHAFFTIGARLHQADCPVPTFGVEWQSFTPFVYLPMWTAAEDPGRSAPFSSVTHWAWGGELPFEYRVVSISKRDAYLRYSDIPSRAGRSFELASEIVALGEIDDRALLESHGWKIVDPLEASRSPRQYQRYIARSRAEFLCPKPVFRELRTGWFSDRSACYLATGRPVLAEDTGFSEVLPTGDGLLAYRTMDEALAAVAEIDGNYTHHSKAAREIAQDLLDSRKGLATILAAAG